MTVHYQLLKGIEYLFRRGYTNVMNAYSQIMSQEGLNGIFKGAHIHALKHLLLNASNYFSF